MQTSTGKAIPQSATVETGTNSQTREAPGASASSAIRKKIDRGAVPLSRPGTTAMARPTRKPIDLAGGHRPDTKPPKAMRPLPNPSLARDGVLPDVGAVYMESFFVAQPRTLPRRSVNAGENAVCVLEPRCWSKRKESGAGSVPTGRTPVRASRTCNRLKRCRDSGLRFGGRRNASVLGAALNRLSAHLANAHTGSAAFGERWRRIRPASDAARNPRHATRCGRGRQVSECREARCRIGSVGPRG